MNTRQPLATPEVMSHRLQQDVPANAPCKSWSAGDTLDAAANLAVLCGGVAIVVLGAATDGQFFLLSLVA